MGEVDTSVALEVLRGNPPAEAAGTGDAMPMLVSMIPPAGTRRTPSDICCVVDVSGSMGAEAVLGEEGHGLSVLDIVKHSLKTIIRTLEATDRLALVTYSNEAQTVFGTTYMDSAGRSTTEAQLETLQPCGMTNLWDGLRVGVDLLKAAQEPGRLQHMMLFTDGLPNINPPRGILPMLKRMKDKEGGKLPCTVSTFGFGYELDSELLSELAIIGSGSYAFIPDAGFVGTVFVNAMSNLLVTMAKDTTLKLKPLNGARFSSTADVLGGYPTTQGEDGAIVLGLGSLQFGQTKDVVAEVVMPAGAAGAEVLEAVLSYGTQHTGASAALSTSSKRGTAEKIVDSVQMARVEHHRLRLRVVDRLRAAVKMMKIIGAATDEKKAAALKDAQALLSELTAELQASPAAASSEPLQELHEDLTGQVAEAFSREDWYYKWGVHFLPSLMSAHLTQTCNNFKDPGVQRYGGDLFQQLRDAADDIFCNMPAPTPGPRAPPPPTPSAAPVMAAPVARPAAAYEPVHMAAYYDRYGGCIEGGACISMADGSLKRLVDVRRGDRVATIAGRPAEVRCLVRTGAPAGRFLLVQLPSGPRLTPYHPVHLNGEWRFPVDIASAEEMPCEGVYQVVLEEGAGAVLADGMPCVSLGHGIHEGAAEHAFFAYPERCLEALARLPGFAEGLVDLKPGSVLRDPVTGQVCGFASPGSTRKEAAADAPKLSAALYGA